MTLIITLLAAVITTIVWYTKLPDNTYRIGVLALTYWAAALMWCVDGIACLIGGEPFVEIADTMAMLDDFILGLVVVVVGLTAWALYLLLKDPRNVMAKVFADRRS
jgi:uncharacterized membrane protein